MNYTYIVECSDHTYYTGWTTNLKHRMKAHNGVIAGGAKYTRIRRPVQLVWYAVFSTKREAQAKEYAIKRLSRKEKEKLIETFTGDDL
ncbi:GIY-YIG nuclease family protein [Veillonella montpellierensis]|uniref:GIY-YIG nuclease family protein n=1 Tax=Veillonella montpellierensis TaxID=187328 RepID=UPI0023F6277A|nr:GIY-YIG nuclease family protein [Veillonella montpellierensis]